MAEILGDEVDLPRSLRLERLRLSHQPLERLGAVLPPHQRDRAERARVVAPLGDLQVAHVGLVPEELPHTGVSGDRVVDQAPLGELGDEMMEVREAEEQVDLGDLALQLLLVALHQATDRHDRLHALRLETCG